VGPFTHLREGTVVGDKVIIGNFLEAVRSRIGRGCIAKHFSYLGDSLVEPQANIGAGTVTANFDGRLKQRTVIGRSAFIGSDTVLIAPVKVGRSALTGAGSVLTRDVPPGCTVAGVPAKIIRRKNG
jgi:bifunctional UDP-N-acetylglucosamine pyrophosphorylase/glucosamine-1-phosphate N-acetyltransferase